MKNNDPIVMQLSRLSEHERYFAEAQLARAEAIVDAVTWVAARVRALFAAVALGFKAWSDERTRRWPHAQA
jgi:hypothetical protein